MRSELNPPSPTGIDRNLTHYADPGFSRYIRRAFLASAGYDEADLERPVVGIADTSSDYTTCHRAMPQLVEAVKRGVLEAGGLPLVFPTLSLGEILLSPTAMLYRNLMAMATEEMIAAQPMDAVVLLGGCDKTLPAQLMAAASASVPAIHLVAGPMLAGDWRGERLGACTDCRRYWAQHRAGALDAEEIAAVEQSLCPTAGTCMVMGTASTMACVTESLGLMLPGAATPPAVSGQRSRLGVATGRRAVALATEGRPARDILTPAAFANALKVLAALSGSTNAVVHLLAIARRAGVDLSLDDFHTAAQQVPLLVDCKPAGTGYMEDFDKAGGVPVLLKALGADARPRYNRSQRPNPRRTLAGCGRTRCVANRDPHLGRAARASVIPRSAKRLARARRSRLEKSHLIPALAQAPRTSHRVRGARRCRAR